MTDESHIATILIVDDEPTARMTVEALLTPDGYEMHFAHTGQEMLDCVGAVRPDVILLDVMMPGMNGFEACEKLKSQAKYRHIPVILLTALTDVTNLVRGLEAGADEFLTKPVNGSELRARVRSMLRIKLQYDEMQAMIKVREELTHMTVHDLRTPLTTVSLYADLVRRNMNRPERVKEYADTIQLQTQRLQNLVNEILMMAKIEKGELSLKKSPILLKDFMKKVKDDHVSAATLKDLNFSLQMPLILPELDLDQSLFRRVIDNLLSNAFKFTPAGSKVSINVKNKASLLSNDKGVQIEISDEGPGVPEEHRERVFDKFAIVEMREYDVPQLGLGLAFCKMVVIAHGGDIRVEENTPQGATFVIDL